MRCPADHVEQVLVLLPEQMSERAVISGTLGCPVCGRTYPIQDGIARFGSAPVPTAESSRLTAEAIATFLDLSGPGGYIAIVGTTGTLGRRLAERVEGVHVVQVNPAAPLPAHPRLSVLAAGSIPLKARSVRGVVLGAGYPGESGWLDEATRVVLPGRRLVAEGAPPPGDSTGPLEVIASAAGIWVAEGRAT